MRRQVEGFVATTYAPQALNQRQNVQMQVEQSLGRIDALPSWWTLSPLAGLRMPRCQTDPAFQVWQATALANYPVTSSVELSAATASSSAASPSICRRIRRRATLRGNAIVHWKIYEEVAPFFAEERRILHAGRAFCSSEPGASRLGSIVVHAMRTTTGTCRSSPRGIRTSS